MDIKHRNKFRLTRFIIFKISPLLQFLSKFRKPEKRILVIKIDAIGDYILFRNYLEVLKSCSRYSSYQVDLLAHEKCKEIVLGYDSQHLNDCFFVNDEKLYEKPLKVLKLGLKLFKRKYEVVVQPTYSRTLMGNGLAGLSSGKSIISYLSSEELHPKYKKRTDKLYTNLIQLPSECIHELDKEHFLFEYLLNQKLPFITPRLPVEVTENLGILIFAGSSTPKKNWEKNKFVEIIHRILEQTEDNIILAGGHSEMAISNYIIGSVHSNRIIDKTASLDLLDFFQLIANSKLVISNDTNTVHVAAACSVPVICILGGGHFERFLPYPSLATNKPVSVFTPMSCYNCGWNCEYHTLWHDPFPCITRVTVESVWKEVKNFL